MQLKLSGYQVKIDCYKYNMFYVTFPQPQKKICKDTQKKKEKESKYITTKKKSMKQIKTKKTAKEETGNKQLQDRQQFFFKKVEKLSAPLSIITLNTNRLNSPIKTQSG